MPEALQLIGDECQRSGDFGGHL